ncbi:MAG TPA: hypothetical protein VK003_02740 [Oceanobacillus sp.]|nr:hypothetical protein [Oceanobacillus sp.]
MPNQFHIPPVFVDAEMSAPPPAGAFRKRPAQQVCVGDLVVLSGQVWRVKDRRTSRTSPRITFTLWPVMGGRPETESFFPREWLPVIPVARCA